MMLDEALKLWWGDGVGSAQGPVKAQGGPARHLCSARGPFMRDPLLPAENDNGGAPTLTLREMTLDLRTVLADLLTFGPGAASRWGMATPPLTSQELDLIRETAMRDGATRDMLAEAGWAGALESGRPRSEAAARSSSPLPRHAAYPALPLHPPMTAAQKVCVLLGGGVTAGGIALWAHLG